jgi:hypothetical protein
VGLGPGPGPGPGRHGEAKILDLTGTRSQRPSVAQLLHCFVLTKLEKPTPYTPLRTTECVAGGYEVCDFCPCSKFQHTRKSQADHLPYQLADVT